MNVRARAIIAVSLLGVVPASAEQQNCADFVRDAFNISIRREGASNSSTFKAWQCSVQLSTHQQALDAGLDVGVVVQGVPLQIGGQFDQARSDSWKQQNCSEEQRSADVRTTSYAFVRTYSPEAAALAARCLDARFGPRAINCSLQGTGASPVFSAEWRRTTGDDNPPAVRRFTVDGGTCTPAYRRGDRISEGGSPTICRVRDDRDLVVLLETSRGSCFETLTRVPVTETLSGRIVLNENRTVSAERIEIAGDARVVTNGHQLTLIASRDIRVNGNPVIESFAADGSVADRGINGRSAGTIVMQTPRIVGTQLTIRNFGEDGRQGPQGPQGPGGNTGQGNAWRNFEGCVGARPGGDGGSGLVGGPGGNGGSGGPVVLSVAAGLNEGALWRVLVERQRLLLDGSTRTCSGSCGGEPGIGGPGGLGGPGGAGGTGSGSCGGSDAGHEGPRGPAGPGGARGADVEPTITR